MLENFNFGYLASSDQTSGLNKFSRNSGAQEIAHSRIRCSGHFSKDTRLTRENSPVRIPERSYLLIERLMASC